MNRSILKGDALFTTQRNHISELRSPITETFEIIFADGVFASEAEVGGRFIALDPIDAEAVQARVRRRILRAFSRRGILGKDEHKEIESWDHGGGFSLDATVRIAADDRRGLERLLHDEAFPFTCPLCGTAMRMVAFITEAAPAQRIPSHIGEPALPPRIAPARGAPAVGGRGLRDPLSRYRALYWRPAC